MIKNPQIISKQNNNDFFLICLEIPQDVDKIKKIAKGLAGWRMLKTAAIYPALWDRTPQRCMKIAPGAPAASSQYRK
jgi:hypothetical protein